MQSDMPDDNIQHVYPVGDIYPHITDGLDCPCFPRIERYTAGTLVIHNSWDMREIDEETRLGPPMMWVHRL